MGLSDLGKKIGNQEKYLAGQRPGYREFPEVGCRRSLSGADIQAGRDYCAARGECFYSAITNFDPNNGECSLEVHCSQPPCDDQYPDDILTPGPSRPIIQGPGR